MSNPLLDQPPSEVRLASPPLVRVLCAIRFSPVMKIIDASGAGVADFQDRIRREYPGLSQEQEHAFQFEVGDHGVPATPLLVTQPVWRFYDKARNWRVSLTRETLGIETQSAYINRDEFIERLVELCAALEGAYEPAQCLRLGVRYVNSLSGDRLSRLPEMITPEFLAFGGKPQSEHLIFSHNSAEFHVPEGRLIARFGILNTLQVHDPVVIEPSPERRYILDLDANFGDPFDFSATDIDVKARALTERIYTVFRGAVTPALLDSCNAG